MFYNNPADLPESNYSTTAWDGMPHEAKTVHRGRVLIVDDDIEVVSTSQVYLSGIGFNVLGCTSGKDALEQLKTYDFDILLIDLVMPEMSGIEVLKSALTVNPHLIGIIMTGQGTIQSAIDAMKAGAFDYLLKPFEFRMLSPILDRAMQVRGLKKSEERYRTRVDELNDQVRKQTEESLQKFKDRYLDLFENANDMIFTFDLHGDFTSVNKTASTLLGFTKEEIIGENIRDLLSSESFQAVSALLQKSLLLKSDLTEFQPWALEVVTKAGSRLPIEVKARLLWENEQIIGVHGIARDITERRQAENELRKTLSLLNSTIESTTDGILVVDTEGKWLKSNRKFMDMWQIPYPIWSSEDDNKALAYVLDQLRDPDGFLSKVRELYAHPEKVSFDIIEFKDGRCFERYSQPQEIAGAILGRVWSFRDVTQRKRAEEALQISEEKYRLVVENANDAIFILQDGRIKFPNRNSILISGYTPQEMTNAHFSDFIHPFDKEMVTDRARRRLQGEDVPPVYSFRVITKSGEIIWVEASAVLVTWEGRPATLNFLRDITIQKKLEEQLLQAQKMEAVGQLAGGIAHDFNNLLTAVIGYGQLLKSKVNHDDRFSGYVNQILIAAEKAAKLTNDLLTFGRKQTISLQPLNLNTVINDTEKLLLKIIGEDIELSPVLTERELTIMADGNQIGQILMNLAANARDAMPDGGRLVIRTDRIEISSEDIKSLGYGKAGSYALLSIEDTGTGIDEEIQKRIFEPFFTTKDVGKGTGLGLSMVYGIVKQHEGYITVHSKPGRGTTFRILFPIIQSTTEKTRPEPAVAVQGGSETILIGEDDPQVRMLLKEVLTNAGYDIVEAVDGDDAIKAFHEHGDRICLLILDIMMPKRNGREAYTEIRGIKSGLKAIFISGYDADVMHKKGISEAESTILSKPVSPDELLRSVRDILDQ